MIHAEQTEDGETTENDRLLAIPVHSPSHKKVNNVKDLERSILEQIENFFLSYTKLQNKKFKIKGCSGPRQAVKLVVRTMRAFKEKTE